MYDSKKPYKKQILELIEQTWVTPYVSVERGIYPVFKRKFSYPEVDHTDGIGTKGYYHWLKKTFGNAVLDALAMNLNDLALVRAVPYKLSNHITVPVEDECVFQIIQVMVEECQRRRIAIVGGENSFHDTSEGLDISMTVSGFIKSSKENKFKVGDALIGFASSGLHSNGFTKVRGVFGDEYRPEFVEPTTIYLDQILDLDKRFDIHGMMHMTGGAFTKLKDLLDSADAIVTDRHKLEPQKIFRDIYDRGVSDKEMYKTFNCGIGFVLSASTENAKKILAETDNADIIGEVIAGTGKVKIESMFSSRKAEF